MLSAKAVKTYKERTNITHVAAARLLILINICVLLRLNAKIVPQGRIFSVAWVKLACPVNIVHRVEIVALVYENASLKEEPLCTALSLRNVVKHALCTLIIASVNGSSDLGIC